MGAFMQRPLNQERRSVRVVVGDEDPQRRALVRSWLDTRAHKANGTDEIFVVGDAGSGEEAFALCVELAPQVVVLEVTLKREEDEFAAELGRDLADLLWAPRLVLYAHTFDASPYYQIIFAQAAGFVDLSRPDAPERLRELVVHSGNRRVFPRDELDN